MVKGAPKCRICKETHFGVCGVGDARGLTASRLDQLETVIARGQRAYIEAGKALGEIRNSRLYREQNYATFEDYCQVKWGFTRVRAYQLIEASAVAGLLTTGLQTVDRTPPTERQARALIKATKRPSGNVAQPPLEPSTIIEQACTHPRHKCADCGKMLDGD